MRVIPPVEMTDARLVSSTAAEPGIGEQTFVYGASPAYSTGDIVILGSPSSTVTITIPSPSDAGVITWTDNGLSNGTPVVLTTTGSLPTGLTANTIYYVVNRATNTFELSETIGGASIVTSGTQSGTHTATAQVHRKYEALADAPNTHPLLDDGTKWSDIGPTNRWAMFDLERNSRTWAASPLTVVIQPGQRIDALSILGLVADGVEIDYNDGSSPSLYTSTNNLSTREVDSWGDYFFAPFGSRPSLLKLNLPLVTSGTLTLTFTRSSGMVGVGSVVFGRSVYLGVTQPDPRDGQQNYSTVDRDPIDQSAIFNPARSIPRTEQRVECAKSNVVSARNARDSLNAKTAVWTGLDDETDGYFEPLLILGFYEVFEIDLTHPDYAYINLTLQEV